MKMNYDPNLVTCGKRAKQTVKLVFAQWEYRFETVVDVGGNCTGLSVIECAISSFADKMFDKSECPELVLAKENGDTLENEIEDEDDLKNMLVYAEILSIEPEEQKTKKTSKKGTP